MLKKTNCKVSCCKHIAFAIAYDGELTYTHTHVYYTADRNYIRIRY